MNTKVKGEQTRRYFSSLSFWRVLSEINVFFFLTVYWLSFIFACSSFLLLTEGLLSLYSLFLLSPSVLSASAYLMAKGETIGV